jgi:hypothetical protein
MSAAEETVDQQDDQDVQDMEQEVPEAQQEAEDPPADQPEPAAEADPEPEEVQVLIGDEQASEVDQEAERAPQWVRELRKSHRELQRKVREYEQAQAKAATVAAPAGQVLPPKPKLEDHDYDTDRYETALEAWYKQRDSVERAKRDAERKAEEERTAWQAKLDAYGKAKGELKVRDYDEAEHQVMEVLSQTQQAVVLQGSENPALVVYALGKNPKRAKELAAVTDPVKFAFAVAKLEAQLKVQPRSKPPAPEKGVPAGTAPVSGASDQTLERLRAEAERTGDYTKVVRFRQQIKAKQRA